MGFIGYFGVFMGHYIGFCMGLIGDCFGFFFAWGFIGV